MHGITHVLCVGAGPLCPKDFVYHDAGEILLDEPSVDIIQLFPGALDFISQVRLGAL